MTTPAARLLCWYDLRRRELPWRGDVDAWAVWVSEVMLQQTRVEKVVPYFQRFVRRFPNPAALAAASDAEVLALWSGLGYYRRARLLRAGAIAVTATGGELPRSAAELVRLPGIGAYSAAAIASIAFGEVTPVLDGNVVRVMARRLASADGAGAAARRKFAAAAGELLDTRRPGDSNQALMELGATLCTPRAPRCSLCPLATGCAAAASGEPERYPRPRRRAASERQRQTAAWVEDPSGRILLARRADDESVLAGLWELPTVATRGPRRAAAALGARYGGDWRLAPPLGLVRHAVTYRALEIELRPARWRADGVGEAGPLDWRTREDAAALALTGATRKLLALRRLPGGG